MTLAEMEATVAPQRVLQPYDTGNTRVVKPLLPPAIILVEDELSGTVQYMRVARDGRYTPLED